jgi:hypothetical protein
MTVLPVQYGVTVINFTVINFQPQKKFHLAGTD